MPALVNLIIGGIAYIIVAKIAGAPPIPKKNNAGNKYTKAGMTCIVSRIGFIKFSNLSLCEHKTPNKTPKNTHSVTERPISANVCSDSSHIPTPPQK